MLRGPAANWSWGLTRGVAGVDQSAYLGIPIHNPLLGISNFENQLRVFRNLYTSPPKEPDDLSNFRVHVNVTVSNGQLETNDGSAVDCRFELACPNCDQDVGFTYVPLQARVP